LFSEEQQTAPGRIPGTTTGVKIMSRIFPAFAGGSAMVAWLALGLFQMFAVIVGIDALVSSWFFSILIWFAVFGLQIPFLAEALTFYGAYADWHWYWALLFAGPGMVYSLIVLFGGLTEWGIEKFKGSPAA
jgi:hypothetical protein